MLTRQLPTDNAVPPIEFIKGFSLFVSLSNSERSLCFYELLNKYDTLYVRFGPLFAYIYENEKISIMTKFKGEKKREIAKEFITKEIVVGKTGGKKR